MSMKNIKNYLKEIGADSQLVKILDDLIEAVKRISVVVRTADTGMAGTKNVYGEEQIALDILSNNIMLAELKKNVYIGVVASEEMDGEVKFGDGEYAVAFDPLDGSSLVDVNFSVGTIAGIYKAKSFIGLKGSEQIASLIVVYGTRTTLFLTVGNGVAYFVLNDDGEFILHKDNLQVGEGKYFAPGNLRACVNRPDYLELLNYWCKNQYTLRYSGGMVPDINHILLKGKGVFVYPGHKDEPDGKLRLLFECAPMSFLIEQAGGSASDGKVRILDKVLKKIEQRTPIFIGSKEEVKRAEEFLK